MEVPEEEILGVRSFVTSLNKSDGVVVVEGKRDAAALKKIGFSGKVIQFHRFGGMINFADSVAKYDSLIILFDGDRTGRYLTGRTIELLERRTNIDLSFKKKLNLITKGKVCFIEQLVMYEPYLV